MHTHLQEKLAGLRDALEAESDIEPVRALVKAHFGDSEPFGAGLALGTLIFRLVELLHQEDLESAASIRKWDEAVKCFRACAADLWNEPSEAPGSLIAARFMVWVHCSSSLQALWQEAKASGEEVCSQFTRAELRGSKPHGIQLMQSLGFYLPCIFQELADIK